MKVLVVDDDVVSRMVLMHLVDSCGTFDIVEAEDGESAWQLLAQGLRPAICFCDLRMPRLSGMDLLERVRAAPALADLPFILVSSASDVATVGQAVQRGASGYVVKPFQPEDVRLHLATHMSAVVGGDTYSAEAPQATLARLGISGERLLAYLGGFHHQLVSATDEFGALFAGADPVPLQLRLERLLAGCVTLGLSGAARALSELMNAPLASAPVQAVLAGALRSVDRQIALVKSGPEA